MAVSGEVSPTSSRRHVVHGPLMNSARSQHSATALMDGRVFIAGGIGENGKVLASSEIYDPETGKFTPAGNMAQPRRAHAAVLLVSGRVLLIGGWGTSGPLSSCELYDPFSGNFLPVASMQEARGAPRAILLQDKRVLVTGGVDANGSSVATAEIYNRNGRFGSAGKMSIGRSYHTATLLPHERVLIIGGRNGDSVLDSSEIYDAETHRYSPVSSMSVSRYKHAAVTLSGNEVLVVGGSNGRKKDTAQWTAEIFDIAAQKFDRAVKLINPRVAIPEPILLPNQKVLVVGSATELEMYDPMTRTLTAIKDKLPRALSDQTGTLLPGGKVLIAGGTDPKHRSTAETWIYQP